MTTKDKDTYFYAIGRRKGAVAQIKLFQSMGNITINKKPPKILGCGKDP